MFYGLNGRLINTYETNVIEYNIDEKERDTICFDLYFYNDKFVDTFSHAEECYLQLLEYSKFKLGFERKDDDLCFSYQNQSVFKLRKIKMRIDSNSIGLSFELYAETQDRDWLEKKVT